MTKKEFNLKYKSYISPKVHFGLEINEPEIITLIDNILSNEIIPHHPDFKFSVIKMKFGTIRCYCNINEFEINILLNNAYNELIKDKVRIFKADTDYISRNNIPAHCNNQEVVILDDTTWKDIDLIHVKLRYDDFCKFYVLSNQLFEI